MRAYSSCGFDIILTSIYRYLCAYLGVFVFVLKYSKSPEFTEFISIFKAFSVAEKERFELSNRVTGYTISNRAPSTN